MPARQRVAYVARSVLGVQLRAPLCLHMLAKAASSAGSEGCTGGLGEGTAQFLMDITLLWWVCVESRRVETSRVECTDCLWEAGGARWTFST